MENKITKRLPEAELEIMLIIWDAEDAVSSTYILERFREQRNWALPTLMTVLTRLVKKGYLNCTKIGRNNSYTPVITGEEYYQYEIGLILSKVFKGSFEHMAKSLIDGKCITKDELVRVANIYK